MVGSRGMEFTASLAPRCSPSLWIGARYVTSRKRGVHSFACSKVFTEPVDRCQVCDKSGKRISQPYLLPGVHRAVLGRCTLCISLNKTWPHAVNPAVIVSPVALTVPVKQDALAGTRADLRWKWKDCFSSLLYICSPHLATMVEIVVLQ